ncbi:MULTISPECIES: aldo/keto reductase [Kitasatospora]|uniref:aldo/keto reductase n=1 Tax=Kitasatospora TaxID=2063 RepID=UPI000C70BCC7|nr:aldo/keto reductase [Kitasatospora sp. GP30]MDH6141238.1 diketogulonate reductase-like aldo/keto reductase [Kitasatospora sp. GP30]
MAATSPYLTLHNGVRMPALGLGVYQSSPEETVRAVSSAIAAGYRLVDTAAAYGNERQVGEGIRRSGIDRDEVFVTTKLWIGDYGQDAALRAFDLSLRKLGLDHVDLYLLHWPVPGDFDATVAAWRSVGKLLAEGRARAIGVCNHNPAHLRELIDRTGLVPAVNQVELHPHFNQRELRAANAAHGIITQSWSPLGGVKVYWPSDPDHIDSPLGTPAILDLAARHSRTPAQVILRWHLQHGLSPIPKSVRESRIAENAAIFDFSLTTDEMAAIDALDTGSRAGLDPELVDTAMFPQQVGE